MIHQVVSTFFSYCSNGAIRVCQSLQRIGTMMPLILALRVFDGAKTIVLLSTCSGRIARGNYPTEMPS